MEKGYRIIVLGMLFLTLHINVFGLKILPSFIGWLIFFNGVRKLNHYEPKKEWKQSGTIALVLAGVTFFSLLMPILDIDMSSRSLVLIFTSVFCYVLELLAEYLVLAGSVSWMNENRFYAWEKKYIVRVRIYTIAVLCNIVFYCVVYTFFIEELCFLAGIINVILKLIYIGMINRIRKYGGIL